MPLDLREVTRQFGRGESTLEIVRGAARTERHDRQLAEQILQLIGEWERSALRDSERARNDLRDRLKALAPPPAPAQTYTRRDPSESIYAAGLRGQQRRG